MNVLGTLTFDAELKFISDVAKCELDSMYLLLETTHNVLLNDSCHQFLGMIEDSS